MTDIIRRKRSGEAWESVNAVDLDEASVGAMEFLSGNVVNIGNGASSLLTFDTKLFGADLLDLSAPTLPTFVDEGIYVLSLSIGRIAAVTAGGSFYAYIGVDNLDDLAHSPYIESDFTSQRNPGIGCLTLATYVAAGAPLYSEVTNYDGVSARDFRVRQLDIQKIG